MRLHNAQNTDRGLFWRAPVPERQPGGPALTEAQLTNAERAMLDGLDAQRRLALLRLIVPGLFAIALLGLPFAIYTDLRSQTAHSSALVGIGLGGFAIAFIALRRRNVNLAALAFFVGLTGVIVMLLLTDGPLTGNLALSVLPQFALLALPIAVAGLFGGPRSVAFVTLACAAFTILLVFLTPHAPDLQRTLAAGNGAVVFTVPISAQLALGILIIATTRGNRRIQRELVSAQVAYQREKELDRLKDQFISSVNHELRTPIMALQGYIELATDLGAQGDVERQRHMLRRGQEAAEHLADLVKSVLNVRRVEADAASMTLSIFALQPVILAATHLLDPREAGEQERALRLHIPPQLAVYADADRVRQILLNLLSNAAKYSSPGSPIEVTARVVQPGGNKRGRSVQRPTVEIAVRDYGHGIPPDQIPLLFQRFVRLERDIASTVTGTGLGLAICRAYVEAMGGRIWAESSGVPGEGSTFSFTLPLTETPVPVALADSIMETAPHAALH